MNITIKYFAQFREQAKTPQEKIEIDGPITMLDLFKQQALHYHFTIDQDIVRFACNNQYVPMSHQLQNNDVVAFISPIAGG